MTSRHKSPSPAQLPEAWKEELYRNSKYQEAAQKRSEEKRARREQQALQITARAGRLKSRS